MLQPRTSASRAARRLRVFYTFLTVLLGTATVVLILSMNSPALWFLVLGMGSLTLGVIALMADTEEGTHALVRDGRLMQSERRVIFIGFAGTLGAGIAGFIEVAIGLRGYDSMILAVIFATATGLFAFVALIRD